MDHRAMNRQRHAELVEIVGRVRRRWRLRLVLRGAAVMLGAALVVFLVSAFTLDRLAFSPVAVITARVLLAVAVIGLLIGFVLLPLRRRVSDEQVALYLEEHEPTLRSALIGALAADAPASNLSPALARRTIETAVERCREVEGGLRIERQALRRASGMLGGVAIAGLLLFLAGPEFIRFGARAIFTPLRTAEAAPLFRVLVQPGDTSVARGADLPVRATLAGFNSQTVDVVMRLEGDSIIQRIPMLPAVDGEGYEVRLFALAQAAEYHVEAGSVRSPSFRVGVLDVPYVDRIDLELRFPAYTGLEPRFIENGGDIAAPAGTTVRLRAHATQLVDGAELVLSDGRTVTLAVDSAGMLAGEFQVRASGLYHVALASRGKSEAASPQYLIDVLDDLRPTVEFSKPGRDITATSVDEVFLEARAQDDYGIRSLELRYSVNGAPEQTIPLYEGGRLAEVTAGHTVFLEEMDLEPGDFISYYAQTTDVGPGAREPVSSDIYFLEIRPFNRNYRQADSGGGGGGGGGGGAEEDTELSRRQRELISATFNLLRDRENYSQAEFTENMVTLADAQEKLREQAMTLAQRLANRGVGQDESFRTILDALPRAAAEMSIASEQLRALSPTEALPPEQRALQFLQRAEAAFRDVQVEMQQGGGGGGGGGSASAQDLADLFGLELDKLSNQYETVQRGGGGEQQAEVDEAAQRVRELARRLERENERLRQAASSQLRNGNAAANQRELADAAEEEARRLERLSRDQSRPDLAETARQLREAADAMRRSAAEGRTPNPDASREALERMRQASRRLDRSQSEGSQSQARDLADRSRQLAEEAREISREMDELPSSEDRFSEGRRLADRKESQARDVEQLQRELRDLAAGTREDQPDASRRLQAASESINRNQLPDAIRASRASTAPNAPREYVRQFEEHIDRGMSELERLTQEASRSFRAETGDQGEMSLDRARDLVRGLESMQERSRQAMGTSMSNREGSQEGAGGQPVPGGEAGGDEGGSAPGRRLGEQPGGQPSEDGEQQAGQSGQAGEQGQSGQPGQEGQGGQQGQPGQEGQGGQQGQPGQEGQGGQQGQPGQAGQGGQQGQAGQGGQSGQGGQQGEGSQPGQGGQQGGGGQDGAGGQGGQGGGQQDGGASRGGYATPGTAGSAGRPGAGSPDPEAVRQLRAEARQRIAEARELREELSGMGMPTEELDRALGEMGRLDDQGTYADWEDLAHIQSAIVDRMKEFEFGLRRTIEGERTRQRFLSGSGEVPAEYREMVERYYRELAETGR